MRQSLVLLLFYRWCGVLFVKNILLTTFSNLSSSMTSPTILKFHNDARVPLASVLLVSVWCLHCCGLWIKIFKSSLSIFYTVLYQVPVNLWTKIQIQIHSKIEGLPIFNNFFVMKKSIFNNLKKRLTCDFLVMILNACSSLYSSMSIFLQVESWKVMVFYSEFYRSHWWESHSIGSNFSI